MGVSSDDILVFGFPVGGRNEPPDLGDADMDDGACPADLTLHCSFDYQMHILSPNSVGNTSKDENNVS